MNAFYDWIDKEKLNFYLFYPGKYNNLLYTFIFGDG